MDELVATQYNRLPRLFDVGDALPWPLDALAEHYADWHNRSVSWNYVYYHPGYRHVGCVRMARPLSAAQACQHLRGSIDMRHRGRPCVGGAHTVHVLEVPPLTNLDVAHLRGSGPALADYAQRLGLTLYEMPG